MKRVLVGLVLGVFPFVVAKGLADGVDKPALLFSKNLTPQNFNDIDFAVPWGLRNGRPSRVYFSYTVGPGGSPENIQLMKAIPHKDFVGVARDALQKFNYGADNAGKNGFAELQYCFLTDDRTPIACKIGFYRISGAKTSKAQDPTEPGFYEIDGQNEKPLVTNYQIPAYPVLAANKSECGWVKVAFKVNTNGRPRKIEIFETSRTGAFNLVTLNALQNFRFSPSEEATQMTYLVTYELPGKCAVQAPNIN